MDLRLPIDVLHVIATELAKQRDFSTLYRCALSSSLFANAGAILNLYRICDKSPIVSGGSELISAEGTLQSEQESIVQKWCILWRSVILSSLGKTAFPYCSFLRVLDLRDLLDLLDDDKFRGRISDHFFSGDLAYLDITTAPITTRKGLRQRRRDKKAIVLSVADSITKRANKLEHVTEPVSELGLLLTGLPLWAGRLSNLQYLQLSDGAALANEDTQDLLVASCPLLHKLEIYNWRNDERSDESLARFLRRLRPNSLTYFQNENDCRIGKETCAAMSAHSESLITLHLAVGDTGIPALGGLRSCTKLESLSLRDLSPPTDMKATQNDVYKDMIAWMQACTNLRHLEFTDFISAPDILAPAMSEPDFQLEHLQINGSERLGGLYLAREAHAFHLALANQTQLNSLLLAADAEGMFVADVNVICDSLCALKQLTRLNISKLSDYFSDIQASKICRLMSNLEELTIDGYTISDATLHELHRLSKLKLVSFAGVTGFSNEALNAYVNKLGPGNQGLVIDIVNPVWEGSLTAAQQQALRMKLEKKVGGIFRYEQPRDPAEVYAFGSDSDSD